MMTAVKMALTLLLVVLMAGCINGGAMANDPNRDPLPEENMNVVRCQLYCMQPNQKCNNSFSSAARRLESLL